MWGGGKGDGSLAAAWQRRQQLGSSGQRNGSLAATAVMAQRCHLHCRTAATRVCGGDKDTGGNSGGWGTDNNQQST
jgi:hypothetical protein